MLAEDFDIIAGHSGLCPVCCDFIAAGRSHIKPLVVPTPPNPANCSYYAERGAWLIQGQYAKRVHARRWAHSRCADQLDQRYTAEEQVALAGDWRAELVAMKRAAMRLHGWPRRGQRPKLSRATA